MEISFFPLTIHGGSAILYKNSKGSVYGIAGPRFVFVSLNDCNE